jgi:Protein of unknown function (DUF1566)/Trypsin-like peptidase domain
MNTQRMPGVATALATVLFLLFLLPIAKGQMISEGPDLDDAKRLVVMIEGNLNGQPTQGAGIIFAVEDGWTYIATAYHLVRKGNARATGLKICFWHSQHQTLPAEHYEDAKYEYDLAVLRVKAPKADFPFERLANLDAVIKSQPAYAIGHPNGEEPWNVTYLPGAISGIEVLHLKVQHPSIKDGHSGGALIDARKMITGIVLRTDGTTADILRIDRAVEILRREFRLPVQLSLPIAPPPVEPSPSTYTDPATKLMWAKRDNMSDVNWDEAVTYCRNLRLGGFRDWRLPEIGELQLLYDSSVYAMKGGIRADSVPVSSTLKKDYVGGEDVMVASYTFHDGTVGTAQLSTRQFRALCVRHAGE